MIRIYPSVFNGSLKAPASKAHAQRLLFAASMASTSTTIYNVPNCEDIKTTLDVLQALGSRIACAGSDRMEVMVEPFPKSNYSQVDLNFRESATTARFATAIAAAFGISLNCKAMGTLVKREQIPLTGRMAIRGANFSSFSYPLAMTGKLRGGDYQLAGDQGSQFISALLMALPNVWEDSSISLTSPLADRSFIDLTLSTLKDFGITVTETEHGFSIPAKQLYTSPGRAFTENDWGLAAMWAVAGAATSHKGGRVNISDLPADSPQMYRSLSNTLALMAQDFTDVNLDCSQCPDLATLFAALAVAKSGTVRISGVPQLRYKETNRLSSIGKCLAVIGADYEETPDGMIVSGKPDFSIPEDVVIDCMGDPMLFMSIAIAASGFDKPVILSDENCAEKVYHNFLGDFKALGGKYEVI